jgi:hypothetical protein
VNSLDWWLIFNANAGDPEANILMDVRDKFPGYTHMALRVASIPATLAPLKANGIAITQGPVSFGEQGHVSVFVRGPRPQRHRIARARAGRDRGRHALRAVSRRRGPGGAAYFISAA